MLSKAIIASLGLDVTSVSSVAGGDINKAFCVSTLHDKYFLKVNDAVRFPEMFNKEADGLAALHFNDLLRVPQVIRSGTASGQQFLLLEWIERGVSTVGSWEKFGAGLAAIHKRPQKVFGWNSDNYIGSLNQRNDSRSTWAEFYRDQRIMPLTQKLRDNGSFKAKDVLDAESFCEHLTEIYPVEHPSLLHGDLWSGNFLFDNRGNACVFDPAVYCGHREMDIAMTQLFGGFDERFYDAYNAAYPLTPGWEMRLAYSKLYPILVHAVLFGGSYVPEAAGILKRFE